MSPLSALYGAVVRGRNVLYDAGVLRTRRLAGPVVSVGNLSVGGAGKTPFVILLGEMLKQRGVAFDVLSRGYGRNTRGTRLVDPEGTAAEFGDEPLLIARKLRASVVVGESRHDAGALAEQKFGPQLHLLDDGFQHRQLARDFNIVLLSKEDLDDRLLPSGRLREPLESLKRADVLVVLEGLRDERLTRFGKPIWQVRRGLAVANAPSRAAAFCGIARPQVFFEQLRAAGVSVVMEKPYRDHHAYSAEDVRQLLTLAKQHGAGGFVTTEKDAVNLGGMLSELGKVTIADVTMQIVDPPDALDTVLCAITNAKRRT
ncbi:MAG TPA: tetraacyldisaccharide 4'-kinase [Terriglobales bacterium]|nr:tetraacyldisaccharide 4'-kinase [Terriglobales bacterium]